jgi:hypothetical protein
MVVPFALSCSKLVEALARLSVTKAAMPNCSLTGCPILSETDHSDGLVLISLAITVE